MFQIQAPILIVPTADAKLAVGVHFQAAGLAAYREIALAAALEDGYEVVFELVTTRQSVAISRHRRSLLRR